MNILFIVNNLSNAAGTERVTCNLANLFSNKLGYHITIANRETKKENVFFPLSSEIEVIALGKNYLLFYKNLNKLIKDMRPDVILVHNMGKLSLLASFLNIPETTSFYTLEHGVFSSRPSWVKFLSKVLYKKYKKIVTLTEHDMKSYQSFHKNVIKIPNISPYDVIDLSNTYDIESRKVIAVGRLTYEKNFVALLKSWEQVEKYYPDWSLDIYGEGEDRTQLERYIIEHKLNNVILKGNVLDLSVAYKTASFLVMSSRYEGLGLVLIEAQSFGLPLISFDCPYGPGEIIHHNTDGLLVRDQNIQELSRAIVELIGNISKRERFSKNAYLSAKKYTKNDILKKWSEIIGLNQNVL